MGADSTPPAQLQLSCIGQALDVEVPVLPLLARLWLALHLSYSSHSCHGQIRPSTCFVYRRRIRRRVQTMARGMPALGKLGRPSILPTAW